MLEGKKKIVAIRTLKTVIAAVLSLIIAQLLGLEFATTVPIIAILCIDDTMKDTSSAVKKRLVSAVLGMAIGTIVFKVFGQNVWDYGLYLLIFLPASFALGIDISLGPTSVLVTHLLQADHIGLGFLLNEMLLMIMGLALQL